MSDRGPAGPGPGPRRGEWDRAGRTRPGAGARGRGPEPAVPRASARPPLSPARPSPPAAGATGAAQPCGGSSGRSRGALAEQKKGNGAPGAGRGAAGLGPRLSWAAPGTGAGLALPPPGSFLGSRRSLQPRGAEVPTAAPWQPPALQRLLEPPVPPAGPSPAPSSLGVLSCCLPQPGLVSPMVLRRDGADAAVAVVLVAVLTPSFPLSGSPVDRCQHRRG